MSTRLKISDSVVINADEIVSMEDWSTVPGVILFIYLTSSTFKTGLADNSKVQNAISIQPVGITSVEAIQKINKALIAAPSGSVVEAPFKTSAFMFGNFENI